MSTLLAIDPSVNSAGVALFDRETRQLIAAARVKSPGTPEDAHGIRCIKMANAIGHWLGSRPAAVIPAELAFEWPQVYTAAKSKGDPNQLLPLVGIGMAVTGLIGRSLENLRTPTPAEWIGQCPKWCSKACAKSPKKCKTCKGSAWKTPRGRRIAERLSKPELALVPDQHDAIDSVGIGLHALGRLVLVRVFPGAV